MKPHGPIVGYMRKCAICGKEICAREEYAYKRGYMNTKQYYFCRYSHMREWDRRKAEEAEKKRKRKEAAKAPDEDEDEVYGGY